MNAFLSLACVAGAIGLGLLIHSLLKQRPVLKQEPVPTPSLDLVDVPEEPAQRRMTWEQMQKQFYSMN